MKRSRPISRWGPFVAAAGVLGGAAVHCGGSSGNGRVDAGVPRPLTVELVNTGSNSVYLEASQRCFVAFELYRVDTDPHEEIKRPTLLDCRCFDCGADACQGFADAPQAWIEIPPGQTVTFEWWGNRYDHETPPTPCDDVGCWMERVASSGQYEVRVPYATWAGASADQQCPTGGPPLIVDDFQSGSFLAQCSDLCPICPCMTPFMDKTELARFDWPADSLVRVELQ